MHGLLGAVFSRFDQVLLRSLPVKDPGRLFTRSDDVTPLGHPVVVLSHSFWQRHATPAVRDGLAYVGTAGGVFNAIQLKDRLRVGIQRRPVSFWGSWAESTAVGGDDGLGYGGSSD